MPPFDPADTIAAVASPPGPALRGLVRLSGRDAFAIALAGFEPGDRLRLDPPRAGPRWVRGELRVEGLRPPLPIALGLWPAPRTYTGEPLAEIHTVGSPPLLGRLLADRLARGARAAEPGEFTLRAFLAGKLDLTRAEAVLGVIDARTPAQLDAALRQLAGGIARPIGRLRDRLLDTLALLEAGLDFADEPDVAGPARDELAAELAAASADLADLGARLGRRDRPEGRPRGVLVGPPNAGKSRLFNALLGRPEAIVADRPGTTRDYLAAPLDLDGFAVELVDTAGLETAADAVARDAQRQRAGQAGSADLRLVCRSADTPPSEPEPGDLLVWTKADAAPAPPGHLPTSAALGIGLAELRRAVAAVLTARDSEGDAPSATAARCGDSLRRAADALHDAATALTLGAGDEFVAVDLRLALDELGKVVGATVTDDILDRIFRRFCIGK